VLNPRFLEIVAASKKQIEKGGTISHEDPGLELDLDGDSSARNT